MGKDKALLEWRNVTLVEHLADMVAHAAGSATLVGEPDRYTKLGLPCLADERPGLGPLSGLETALTHTKAQWNLVIACDLSGVNVRILNDLFQLIESTHRHIAVVRDGSGSVQPLCAVYNRCCLPTIRAALDARASRP